MNWRVPETVPTNNTSRMRKATEPVPKLTFDLVTKKCTNASIRKPKYNGNLALKRAYESRRESVARALFHDGKEKEVVTRERVLKLGSRLVINCPKGAISWVIKTTEADWDASLKFPSKRTLVLERIGSNRKL